MHLGQGLLICVGQVEVIKGCKNALIAFMRQQMFQFLTDGGFARPLWGAHPNKQGGVWVRLLMLLELM